jgi:hypothetical protein
MVYSEDRSTQKDTSSSAVTSSLSHTPGPWSIDDTSGQDLVWADGAIVAHAVHPKNWPADARLIAAAPDLLEALLAIVSPSGGFYCDHKTQGLAKAAIAKARSIPAI